MEHFWYVVNLDHQPDSHSNVPHRYGAVVRLTTHPPRDQASAWSPDGRQIAFTSARDGDNEIFVMNEDSSDQRQLTDNASDDFYQVWSLTGSRNAFFSDRGGNPT